MRCLSLVLTCALLGWLPTAAQTTPPEPFQPPPVERPAAPEDPKDVAPEAAGIRLRVSGHAGLTGFAATDSFDAILGTTSGATYGGGAGVLLGRHLFVDAQVSRFSADGERVFVTNDRQVFQLGIPTTVTVTPFDLSVGWRFTPGAPRPGRPARRPGGFRPVPFGGGGVGLVQYRETAEFAQAGDDVSESHASYHVLGGVELPISRRIAVSADGLYRWVPDALGESGVSAVYGETDLGGYTIRARAIFTF